MHLSIKILYIYIYIYIYMVRKVRKTSRKLNRKRYTRKKCARKKYTRKKYIRKKYIRKNNNRTKRRRIIKGGTWGDKDDQVVQKLSRMFEGHDGVLPVVWRSWRTTCCKCGVNVGRALLFGKKVHYCRMCGSKVCEECSTNVYLDLPDIHVKGTFRMGNEHAALFNQTFPGGVVLNATVPAEPPHQGDTMGEGEASDEEAGDEEVHPWAVALKDLPTLSNLEGKSEQELEKIKKSLVGRLENIKLPATTLAKLTPEDKLVAWKKEAGDTRKVNKILAAVLQLLAKQTVMDEGLLKTQREALSEMNRIRDVDREINAGEIAEEARAAAEEAAQLGDPFSGELENPNDSRDQQRTQKYGVRAISVPNSEGNE